MYFETTEFYNGSSCILKLQNSQSNYYLKFILANQKCRIDFAEQPVKGTAVSGCFLFSDCMKERPHITQILLLIFFFLDISEAAGCMFSLFQSTNMDADI